MFLKQHKIESLKFIFENVSIIVRSCSKKWCILPIKIIYANIKIHEKMYLSTLKNIQNENFQWIFKPIC